jgi:hypothetical protein
METTPGVAIHRTTDYLPFQIKQTSLGVRVVWANVPADEFREPFLFQTFQRLYDHATAQLFVETPLDALLAKENAEGTGVNGMIYHISRCGSTLLTNALSACGTTIALSEPPMPLSFLMTLMQHPDAYGDAAVVAILRATFVAIRQCCEAEASSVVIKMFSGNVFQLPFIRAAAPESREVFLYRDPVEVLLSNVATPDQRWVWEEGMTGVCASTAIEMPVVELFARAIGRMLTAMRNSLRPNTLLINYAELNYDTVRMVADYLDLSTTDAGLMTMRTVLGYRAKEAHRRAPFAPDSAQKQARASARLRRLALEYCDEHYAALEEIRIRQT